MERIGKPCVGCGYCCIEATCTLGLLLHPAHMREQCPSLYWDEAQSMYRCKEVAEFSHSLYIGQGCCSPLNSWRTDVRRRD